MDTAVEAGIANFGPANRELIDFSDIEDDLAEERLHRFNNRRDCGQEAATLNEDRRVMVPYMFCSDEWVGMPTATAGTKADPAAGLERTMNQREDYYGFNNYKRDR